MPARSSTDPLVLNPPRIERDGGESTVSLDVSLDGRSHAIYFKVSSGPIADGVEPFLVASLFSAMRARHEIAVAAPVSPMLADAVPGIVSLFSGWFPAFHSVSVDIPSRRPVRDPEGRGVGLFFSGGVDSLYTLLRHLDEIDTLIFVTGFDINCRNTDLIRRARAAMRGVADAYGKRLIEVETNLRSMTDHYGEWASHLHGSGLTAVAHILSPQIEKVYIAASFSRRHLCPHGSHPDLDPLWSTEAVRFTHDGLDANRVEKIAAIAQSDIAMRHLRVCWENRGNAYNCGRCEKCIRTMVAMRSLGILDRCTAFDRPLDLKAVSRIAMVNPKYLTIFEGNLEAIRARGGDPPLEKAIRASLSNRYYRGPWKIGRRLWWRVKARLKFLRPKAI